MNNGHFFSTFITNKPNLAHIVCWYMAEHEASGFKPSEQVFCGLIIIIMLSRSQPVMMMKVYGLKAG